MNKPFIIKSKDTKTTSWSGGETTELFIYPESSNFKELNFDFRLSTATIEVDESNFTTLKDVNRTLLLLDGELILEHKDHHKIQLQKFEIDSFKGDWETKSFGNAVDFNFMSTRNLNEKINVLKILKRAELTEKNLNSFTCLYIYEGEIKTSCGIATRGDIFINPSKGIFKYSTIENSIIVHITIDLD